MRSNFSKEVKKEDSFKTSYPTFRGTVKFIWFVFLLSSVLCGGFIMHDYISSSIDLSTLIAGPIFIVLSFFTIVIPSYYKVIFINKYFSNLVRWLGVLAFVFCVIFLFDIVPNWSPIVYSVEYFDETGISIDFREDNTFKSRNTDIFKTSIAYGKYKRKEGQIILMDEIKLGRLRMNDTLLINDKGLDFTFAKSWRVSSRAQDFKR